MSAEAYLESTAKKQQCSRMSSRSLSLYFKYFFLFELNTLLSHSPQKSQVNNWTANKQKMLGFPQRAQKSVLHHSPRQGTVVSCKCAFFFFLFFFRVGNESANATGVQGEMSGAISTVGLSQALGWILAEGADP